MYTNIGNICLLKELYLKNDPHRPSRFLLGGLFRSPLPTKAEHNEF
jgi:hypothetical protein